MKSLVIAALAASTLLVSPALARGPAETPAAEKANGNACFGIDRAVYFNDEANGWPGVQGEASSERKGDNAEMNQDYRDLCTVE